MTSILTLTPVQLRAAGHTLWQAALASGGIGTIVDASAGGHVSLPGIEQGGIVAAVAVLGAGLSLAKALGLNIVAARRAGVSAKAADATQAHLQADVARVGEIERVARAVLASIQQAPVLPVTLTSQPSTVGDVTAATFAAAALATAQKVAESSADLSADHYKAA